MNRLKHLKKTTKVDFLTYLGVILAFAAVTLLQSMGMVDRSVSGMLVPICCYVSMAVSLNLVVGISGELSLGHAGFMSIGAFSGVIAAMSLQSAIPSAPLRLAVAMAVGALFAAAAGFVVGIPVLRLRGDYLAIVTLAFGEIIKELINCLLVGYDENGLHIALNLTGGETIESLALAPGGIAMAVRDAKGRIILDYKEYQTKAQKGTFYGLPIVRGVVAFVESLTIGMNTLTRSAELIGDPIDEEPTKFEKWLSEKLGKSVEKVVMGLAVILAVALSVGLFFLLPQFISSLIFRGSAATSATKCLVEGLVRLCIFIGYILFCASVKDIKRVFMYHGAEHKTIACYEADDPLTPENAMKHSRLHPRCGTNYLFLVMAVSIVFFAVVGWNESLWLRLLSRIVFLPLVAGLSYEVLKLAAKYENIFTKIIRAPGMALQYITTKEPTADMLEVAIASFNLAMSEPKEAMEMVRKNREETADKAETAEALAGQA